MSPETLLSELAENGLLPPEQTNRITDYERLKPFSVHHELRGVLYVGIGLLSAGLGWLLYEQYDQIGPNMILAGLSLLCVGCFVMVWQNRPPISALYVEPRSKLAGPVLLLGCLLFLTIEGYAQYEYQIFGTRYGLVTLLPALLFLALAYRFDHAGVLGLGITALISWVGVTIRPLEFYVKGNFVDARITASALAVALLLIVVAQALARQRLKAHFTFTYMLLAGNLLFVALLAGLFNFETWRVPVTLGLLLACFAADRYARQPSQKTVEPDPANWIFLLMGAVYGFIGLTFLFFTYLPAVDTLVIALYFIAIGLVLIQYLLTAGRRFAGKPAFPKPLPTPNESL
jgi:hypothetical protein